MKQPQPDQTKLTPQQVAVTTSLFAFAQNFGFDWHPSFIKWMRESLMREFQINHIECAVIRTMLKEERPWSPYGTLHKECIGVEEEEYRAVARSQRLAEEKREQEELAAARKATPEEKERRRKDLAEKQKEWARRAADVLDK